MSSKSNIRELAEFLHRTGKGHELLTALDALLSEGMPTTEQEGGEDA